MEDLIQAGRNFEAFVDKLFRHSGYTLYKTKSSSVDFHIQKGEHVWATEVKHYKTQRAQLKLLSNAANQIQHERAKDPKLGGMLITSCQITNDQKLHLASLYDIIIIDRQILFHFASSSPELTEELYSILEIEPNYSSTSIEDFYETEKEVAPRQHNEINIEVPAPEPSPVDPATRGAIDTTGSDLCKELRAMPKGKKKWSDYEKLCERILKFLFSDHLAGWSKQHGTDDELNRFDYVCRIIPSTDFWNFILQQMHSRYIIFEFKNYETPIKQGQVLTTEKYLLEKGLRRVAIMFTREGAHSSALKTAQGAMRESGKLILILNDTQICQMLEMKEKGSDPTDFLFEITDSFLLSLPR
jgi:hypothetical protein